MRRRKRELRKASASASATSKQLLSDLELFRLVWGYYTSADRLGPEAIQERLSKLEEPIKITRAKVYDLFRDAADHGWLRFVAPPDDELRRQLKKCFPFLQGIEVVQTRRFEDVAHSAAQMLLDLVRAHKPSQDSDRLVHIGYAGGYSMRAVAQNMAESLRQPVADFPGRMSLHALVAGFHLTDPTTDPNAFFTYFVDPRLTVRTEFVGLHAPAIARVDRIGEIKATEGIKESFDRRDEIDIIVTSASRYSDKCKHSQLYSVLNRIPPPKYRCDILWQPLSEDGPIDEPETRAVTVFDLHELPDFIANRKSVLLVLGPCAACHEPKTDVLDTVLNLRTPLITHLVVDSRSAAEVLRRKH